MKPNTVLRTSNAEGILLLHQGNTQAARRCFEVSIKCLVSRMESSEPAYDENVECHTGVSIAAVSLDMSETRPEYAVSPEGIFEVCGKCFILKGESLQSTRQEVAAAAILFNTAIALHMDFLKTGILKCLQRASSFYCKAFQIMSMNGDVAHASVDTVECMLFLAILNNLGHCFAHVFDTGSATACRERIRDILMCRFHQLREEGYGFEDDFESFLSIHAIENGESVLMKISPAA